MTGSGLQISKKQSIPNRDKKVYVFNLQCLIKNFMNFSFHCFFTPPSPVVFSNGYPNEIQKIALLFKLESEIMGLLREFDKTRKQLSGGGGIKKSEGGLKKRGIQEIGEWGERKGGSRYLFILI